MTVEIHGLDPEWPIYRIDSDGERSHVGSLKTCADRGMILTGAWPPWLQADRGNGCFRGVPWFLHDMPPRGFMGSDAPTDPTLRGDVAHLASLVGLAHGVGDLMIADVERSHASDAPTETVEAADRALCYGELARTALSADSRGPQVSGAQPKFTTIVTDPDGTLRHVIVKFSEPADSSVSARRQADLLVAEHMAAEWLSARGNPAACSTLIWSDRRLCLEVTRFDRIGAHGRRGCVSLAAWCEGHAPPRRGIRDDWRKAVARMAEGGWLSTEGVHQVMQRWWFGYMIGNDHMHFGNLSFFLNDDLPLTLTPGFDMLPSSYMPGTKGLLSTYALQPALPDPDDLPYWSEAADWALGYWAALAGHAMISTGFREVCAANQRAISRAQNGVLRRAVSAARRAAKKTA